MGQKGHIMVQKGLKMHKKRQKIEFWGKWGVARMVIVPKPTPPGEPPKIRRTIDYKWLNAHISPSTWHNSPPLQQAEGVDKDGYKTVLDARDGFHSIPLAEESRKWTQFMTESEGLMRAVVLPQGCIRDAVKNVLAEFVR